MGKAVGGGGRGGGGRTGVEWRVGRRGEEKGEVVWGGGGVCVCCLKVCLSALPTAVRFYQRLGFKSFDDIKIETNQENLIEGQVYMEKKLRQRPRQRRR